MINAYVVASAQKFHLLNMVELLNFIKPVRADFGLENMNYICIFLIA